jgi:putative DNA primase/helicase
MSAADIASALGEARRDGRFWRCRCPLHGGRSLEIRDGDVGRLLVTCWGGCNRLDVLAELRRRSLLGERFDSSPHVSSAPRRRGDATRTARALGMWRAAPEGADKIACRYRATRGIVLDRWPPSLRFHLCCSRPKDDAGNFLPSLPAMVALIEHVERGPIGVHCTYLRGDGSGKADVEKQKAMFGEAGGGAVRLGLPCEEQWFAVAEGIETALSIAVACSMPVWAALSAGGIKKLILPQDATHVVICADHDKNGIGERAALDAAARWLAEGRRVRIALPPQPDTDFNDMLIGRSMGKLDEARHVA